MDQIFSILVIFLKFICYGYMYLYDISTRKIKALLAPITRTFCLSFYTSVLLYCLCCQKYRQDFCTQRFCVMEAR